jgi:asparagine synthase (glutamine-hydrolysing)
VGARPTQLALLERGHLGRRTASWVQHGRAIGVDYTWPLLDRRIIEFALSLPGEAFLRAGWKRWLFREAVEGLVPDVIRWNRHKRDPALAAQFKRARSERARIEAGRLRDIGEHPLVDVARMAETIQRQGESPTASDPAEAAVARVAFLTTIHPRFTF